MAKFLAGDSPRAGESISVFGFPLAEALSSGGNIVAGNITALSGLGNDARACQISAPIQPGNSGGPLLNSSGQVVGIVNAKLDEIAWASKTGNLPQNVNFAIKANIATNFMEVHSIPFEVELTAEDLSLADVREVAERFTFLIVCQK